MWCQGAHEDVAWEEGFEVDEGEGVGGCEEDLCVKKVNTVSEQLGIDKSENQRTCEVTSYGPNFIFALDVAILNRDISWTSGVSVCRQRYLSIVFGL